MSVSSTVRNLLELKDVNQIDIADKLGTTKQNITNKFSRDKFYATDLVEIAELLGLKLAFIDEEFGQRYIITKD